MWIHAILESNQQHFLFSYLNTAGDCCLAAKENVYKERWKLIRASKYKNVTCSNNIKCVSF